MVIEDCAALGDGGGIYALAPVVFRAVGDGSSVGDGSPRTILARNSASGQGGGLASWAPLQVEFGHRLVVCDFFPLFFVEAKISQNANFKLVDK